MSPERIVGFEAKLSSKALHAITTTIDVLKRSDLIPPEVKKELFDNIPTGKLHANDLEFMLKLQGKKHTISFTQLSEKGGTVLKIDTPEGYVEILHNGDEANPQGRFKYARNLSILVNSETALIATEEFLPTFYRQLGPYD
ncbi:MAG: hypothetical protein ABH812_00975 [bacterium]